ncbi:MAG: Pathogenicity locus [Bacteroidetes bacterium]|nr:Pathogenicity locus [Bacteroidota bacterium]
MKKKTNIKLPLTDIEKLCLKKHKVRISAVPDYAVDELEVLLDSTYERAKEILALAEFQMIPSVGIKFAEDLVFMGFYAIDDLKDKDGAKLTEEYELKKGYWIDPCLEDQFRLIVHYANTKDATKVWWDFTDERKNYRLENGYPASRPKKAWHETLDYKRKNL